MKKVSIIVPLYNKISFLKKGLLSLLNQTYKNIEVFIIDDGSTDGSFQYAKKMLVNDKRFIILRQEHSGVSTARNLGLKKANGDFVIFFDADDELRLDYVAELVDNYKNCQLVVSGLVTRNYKTGNFINSYNLNSDQFDTNQYHKIFNKRNYTIFALPICKLFNLKIIRNKGLKFDKQQFGEDSIFVLNYLGQIRKVRVINYSGYINNIIPGTLSRRYVQNIDSQLANILCALKANFPLLDNESWNFMLCRSIKLTLFNAVRPGFKNFIDECKRLFNNSTYNNIKVTSNLGIKDTIVIFMFKNRLSIALFLIFKLMSHSN